ncbi:hypothetical protein ACQKIE_00615 [Luteibacter sp. NPDC031894]|uniref:hypothetical protein n=1 Tax=Luteibacter sp. NPDC031894 TaxID=3390572 RepID=UPI003CFCA78B
MSRDIYDEANAHLLRSDLASIARLLSGEACTTHVRQWQQLMDRQSRSVPTQSSTQSLPGPQPTRWDGNPKTPGPETMHRTAALLVSLLPLISFADGTAMNKPDVKLNPHPRMRYEITVQVEGAPGPFDRVEGVVDYRVANEACVPLTPVTGATVAPEKRVPIALTRTGDGVYKGEMFADLLQDEDYFGKGVCHWSVVAASANLFVKKVDFSAPLFRDDLFNGKYTTRYYSNRSYATTQLDRIDVGEADRAQYQDEARATFSITVRAEEKRP